MTLPLFISGDSYGIPPLFILKTEMIFLFWASTLEQELRIWKMFSGTSISQENEYISGESYGAPLLFISKEAMA
jgi:hypothetical protein